VSLAFVVVCYERCGDRTDAFDCCVLLLLHRNLFETYAAEGRGEGTSETVIRMDIKNGWEYDMCTGQHENLLPYKNVFQDYNPLIEETTNRRNVAHQLSAY